MFNDNIKLVHTPYLPVKAAITYGDFQPDTVWITKEPWKSPEFEIVIMIA